MPKKKYTLREKPCLECGKMHKKRRYCSNKCGMKYRKRKNKPNPSRYINSIIYGLSSDPKPDQNFSFVFSNKFEDWTRAYHRKYNDLRKEEYHRVKAEQMETNTVKQDQSNC